MFADVPAEVWTQLALFLAAMSPLVAILTTILQTRYQEQRKAADDRKKAEVDAAKDAVKVVEEKRAKDQLAEKVTAATQQAAEKVKEETVAAVSRVGEKVEQVHSTVNGEGLGMAVRTLQDWTVDHEAKDEARHRELLTNFAEVRGLVAKGKP